MTLSNKKYLRVLVLFCVLSVVFSAGYKIIFVKGDSMAPTMPHGSIILADKLRYKIFDPARFDIAVIRDKEDGGYMVKRIIGLPHEKVEIKNGNIYIDDKKVQCPFGKKAFEGMVWGPRHLAKDIYFYIGDNREETVYGLIHRRDILYKKI